MTSTLEVCFSHHRLKRKPAQLIQVDNSVLLSMFMWMSWILPVLSIEWMLGLDSAWPEAVTVVYQNIQFIFYLPARFFFYYRWFSLNWFHWKKPQDKTTKKKKKKYQLLPPNTSKLSQSLSPEIWVGVFLVVLKSVCSQKKKRTQILKKK